MHEYPRNPTFDSVSERRVNPLAGCGFTQRQREFLVTVMVHAGCFGQMMRNPIYVGRVESPDYGVSTQGDFEPPVDEATFYRAQAVLDGRIVVAGPR